MTTSLPQDIGIKITNQENLNKKKTVSRKIQKNICEVNMVGGYGRWVTVGYIHSNARSLLFLASVGPGVCCVPKYPLRFLAGCYQYQCNWLPGKICPRNDRLCVECDVKPCSTQLDSSCQLYLICILHFYYDNGVCFHHITRTRFILIIMYCPTQLLNWICDYFGRSFYVCCQSAVWEIM